MNKVFLRSNSKRFLFILITCIPLFSFVLFNNLRFGILVCFLFFACFGELIKDYIKTGFLLFFEPKYFFLAFYFLLHGFGFYTYQVRQSLGLTIYNHAENLIWLSLLYALFGVCVFHFSYWLTMKFASFRKMDFSFIKLKPLYSLPFTNWLLLLSLIIFINFLLWILMGGIPFSIENYHQLERANVGKGLGLLEAFGRSALSSSLIFFIVYWKESKYSRFEFVFYLLAISIIYFFNADRGGLINYIISLCFLYTLCKSTKIKLKYFLTFIVGLVFLASLLGALRSKNLTDFAVVSTVALTEISVEFDNYVEIYSMFENQDYLYGSTLIPIFTLPIPRILLPNKDDFLTAGNYFKFFHNHTHIRVGERLSYVGELYMNFGVCGIFIGMFIIGYLLAVIVKKRSLRSSLAIYIYIQLVLSCKSFIAGDIPTAAITFFMNNIFVLIVIVMVFFYISVQKYILLKDESIY